jgi:ubiquitin C-terminal hydrolase
MGFEHGMFDDNSVLGTSRYAVFDVNCLLDCFQNQTTPALLREKNRWSTPLKDKKR